MTFRDLAARPHEAGLVIFDCDGVLIDSEWIACEVFAEVLCKHGFSCTAEDIADWLLGMSSRSTMIILERQFGRVPGPEVMTAIRHRTQDAFSERLKAMPGIRELLSWLRPKRCVASSSDPERLRHSLGHVGLYDRLAPNIFSATMVANGKPAPDLFLYAAAEMETDPVDCVVIEDSVAGITAARAAGMTAIGFTGGEHCGERHTADLLAAGAHRVIASYEELMPQPLTLVQT